MDNTRALDNPRFFQLNDLCTPVIEQPDTLTEQLGHQVNLDLVEKAGCQVLPGGIRTSADHNIPIVCACCCLLQCAFDAIGDKNK
jgi:hypothetical protein